MPNIETMEADVFDTLNQVSVTCQDEALLLNASVGSQMAANTANVTSRDTRG